MSWLSHGLIWVVEGFGEFCPGEIVAGHVSLTIVILYYIGMIAVVWFWYMKPKWLVVCVVSFIVIISLGIGIGRYQQPDFEMMVLDVGHGQAIVVKSPDGVYLFDAGSQFKKDVGSKIVLPFLKYKGITHIDAIIISHDDLDHINGIIEIVRDCDVASVYASDAFLADINDSSTARHLASELGNSGLQIESLAKAELDNVRFFWPDEVLCADETLSDNDTSVVSLIEYSSRRVLLCSDIGKYAQRRLIESGVDIKADVVVVPHHGSLRTMDSKFIEMVWPEYHIVSSGLKHYEGFKKNELDESWYFTAAEGAVNVTVDGGGNLDVSTCR